MSRDNHDGPAGGASPPPDGCLALARLVYAAGRWPRAGANWLLRRRGYFGPKRYEAVAVFLLAVATGLVVYAWKVRGAYVEVYRAYAAARVSDDLLSPDPAVPARPTDAVTADADQRRLFRALQLLKLQTDEDTPEGMDKTNARLIKEAMRYPPAANAECRRDECFTHAPTAALLVHLVLHVPGARTGAANDPEYQRGLVRLVAAVLANQPGAAPAFRAALKQFHDAGAAPAPGELMKGLGDDLPLARAFVFSSEDPPPVTNLELIAALYQLTGVDRAYDPTAAKADPEAQAQLRALTKFLEALVERARADRAVKHGTRQIPLWQGYEQCAMWVVFAWTLYLLLYREVRRWWIGAECGRVVRFLESVIGRYPALSYAVRAKAADRIHSFYAGVPLIDVRKRFRADEFAARIARVCANFLLVTGGAAPPRVSGFRDYCREVRQRESGGRWFIKWLALALPAIGFIGTKRGIAGALSQADIIVRAQDPGAQATAISTVTGVLGIAFTTTLIALLMGLVISLINYAQMHREAVLVDELEETLVPLLEPERVQAVPSAPPPGAAGS